MLKGSVLRFGFLDCMGALIQSPYEVWRDLNAPEDPDRPRRRKLVHFSPSSSQDACGEGHLAVVCSERQAKVFLMPSQSCLFVHNITESSFVLRADVVSVSNSVCLACFCANGHVMTLRYDHRHFSGFCVCLNFGHLLHAEYKLKLILPVISITWAHFNSSLYANGYFLVWELWLGLELQN